MDRRLPRPTGRLCLRPAKPRHRRRGKRSPNFARRTGRHFSRAFAGRVIRRMTPKISCKGFSTASWRDYLRDVDRAKGRFLSFLLASLRHFVSNERRAQSIQRRRGGRFMSHWTSRAWLNAVKPPVSGSRPNWCLTACGPRQSWERRRVSCAMNMPERAALRSTKSSAPGSPPKRNRAMARAAPRNGA